MSVELCDRTAAASAGSSATNCYTRRTVDPQGGITIASAPRRSLVALTLIIETVFDEDYYEAIAPQRLFEVEDEVCAVNPCRHGGDCFPENGDLSTGTMRYTYRYVK